ncbi:MAG: homocitrate synthase [Syntrophomonadaceae bacterium]|nr:homocitrate synthase [Syntrophomonadaceae bacterium]
MTLGNIVDTTLRDGEQAPGIVFSKEDKKYIALMLDKAGVFEIEAGTPAMGTGECEALAAVLELNPNTRISTWNRAHLKDIKASLGCGARHLHLSLPVSDIQIRYKLRKTRGWVLNQLKETVHFARAAGAAVTIGAEDASRADFRFLLEYACLARELGAERLRYADTVGVLDPFKTYSQVQQLINESGMAIEFHAHNDFALAVANTLAAVRAGAQFASTTVLGLGERAGNCPLETIIDVFDQFLPESIPLNRKAVNELVRYVTSVTAGVASA